MKALIFDLDGTLLNTIGDLEVSTNYALKKFGFPLRSREEVNAFVGNGLRMLIRRAVPQSASEETVTEVLAVMKEYYTEHFHDYTVPYAGIMELIESCKERNIPMAIVSNKADVLVKKLNALFFGGLIDVAIGEADDLPRKPAPDMVFRAMDELGIKDGIYVGDSEVDIQTAKNAGLPCLSVSWGFRSKELLKEAGAEIMISDPNDILKFVMK